MDPLAELDNALWTHRGGRAMGVPVVERLPLTWLVAHAPTGSLQARWDESRNPIAMLRLAARVVDPELVVRAACRCARVALQGAPEIAPQLLPALRAAEAWTPDQADDQGAGAALELAARIAADCWANSLPAVAAEGVVHALRAASGDEKARAHHAVRAVEAAVEALERAACGADERVVDATRDGATRQVAGVLRGVLPCPDLAALLRQFGRNA